MKKLSVIITAYNVESYIEECVKSVCNQTYRNLEIIIVDDGSTDQSGTICENFAKEDERITVIHRPNGGVSLARNIGLAASSGEYIAFVDGDDYLDTSMYESLVSCIEQYSSQMAVCSFYFTYGAKKKKYKKCMQDGEYVPTEYLQAWMKTPFDYYYSVVWNKIFRLDVMKENKLWFDETLIVMEDLKLTLELLSHITSIAVCAKALYCYRKNNPQAVTRQANSYEQNYKNRIVGSTCLSKCLKAYGIYEDNRKAMEDYIVRYLASQHFKAIRATERKSELQQYREIKKRDELQGMIQEMSSWRYRRRFLHWWCYNCVEATFNNIRQQLKKICGHRRS